jgi:hypothetical protein
MNGNTMARSISLAAGVGLAMAALAPLAAAGDGQLAKVESNAMSNPMADHSAHGATSIHVVHMAGTMETLAHEMVVHALLVALEVKQAEHLEHLGMEYASFEKLLRALRHGDEEMAIPATGNPKILAKLAIVEDAWSRFAPAIENITEQGAATSQDVAAIATQTRVLMGATRHAVELYRYYSTGGKAFSALSETVSMAERQHALIRQLTTEFLFVKLGHQEVRFRAALSNSSADFAESLKALRDGNPQLRVIPAPTPELQKQYRLIARMWAGLDPQLKTTLDDAAASPETILAMVERSLQLSDELDKAIDLFHEL